MGCDIHLYIEYKVNDGEWTADPHHTMYDDDEGYLRDVSASGRDYSLFGALAGVRGDGPDPKGLPDDISPIIKSAAERYGDDGHSHSWTSLKDFKKILKDLGYEFPKSKDAFFNYGDYDFTTNPPPPAFTTVVNYCEDMENNIEWIVFEKAVLTGGKGKYKIDVRLVYWFDN